MGLFDGFIDPEQFGNGGGLLSRLLVLQQQQGQYQPGAGFDQAPSVSQTSLLASMLPPLPDDGQPPVDWQTSAPSPNAQSAAPWPKPGDQSGAAETYFLFF